MVRVRKVRALQSVPRALAGVVLAGGLQVDRFVLIPFKAGQWFKLGNFHQRGMEQAVLIPFKAGQWFKRLENRFHA